MSESYDYKPATSFAGHDFAAARAAYDVYRGKSYDDAVKRGIDAGSLIEKTVSTKAQRPLVIVVDQTGSMGEWPATMFSKLPFLDHEVKWYLGKDAEICFAAIGDANNNEDYPLQVRPFGIGADLTKRLQELIIEANGGGQMSETYELAALYFARNMDVDPMAEPIIIFIGDEKFYDTISVANAKKYCGVALEKAMSSREAFAILQGNASVYFIQKPYGRGGSGDMDPSTRDVHRKWANLVGDDHMAILPDPERVVDVIFGILAQETGRTADFKKEIGERQRPEQIAVVMKSLKTIHAISSGAKALPKGSSTLLVDDDDASPSSSLLGE